MNKEEKLMKEKEMFMNIQIPGQVLFLYYVILIFLTRVSF